MKFAIPLRYRKIPLLFSFAILVLSSQPIYSEDFFPPEQELKVILEKMVESHGAMGMVVGLIDSDGTQQIHTYGESGIPGKPLDGNSVFEIASITKTFTGILLAEMVRRGEARFEDPIEDYLPASVKVPSRNGKKITLIDLATHHSGLPRVPSNFAPADIENPYADYPIEKMYDFLNDYQLARDPGESFEYSNFAMGLLGYAMAQGQGLSYEELLQEWILKPIGMSHTSTLISPEMKAHFVPGFKENGDPAKLRERTFTVGSGGIKSTANDMLKFAAANLFPEGSGLASSMQESHKMRHLIIENAGAGIGWGVDERNERKGVEHSGGNLGYSSFLALDLKERRRVIVLVNSGGSDFTNLGRHLLYPSIELKYPEVEAFMGVDVRVLGILGVILVIIVSWFWISKSKAG